jgi:hypothetical protein
MRPIVEEVGAPTLPMGRQHLHRLQRVLVTFQVQKDQEPRLQQVLSKAWATYVRLGMVRRDPHLLLKSTDEKGNTTMFEILSWKDSSVPDNPGPEVRKLWNEMEGLCEKRAEQPA